MDEALGRALARGGLADITTIGRKSGRSRRIEIVFHQLDGELYITGRPGFKRDWIANLSANPGLTLHLKRGVSADLPATVELVTDPDERRRILYRILTERWDVDPERARRELDRWVESAPLVRLQVA